MPTESFFSSASLAYIASAGAGKDGKTYSIKPTDGSGDFTFSRGSNLAATRVGPTGLIEKGRENLLLQSNSFDTTWVSVSASVTSGQSGYDGSTDAWLLSKSGANGRIQQSLSTGGVSILSVYAKANISNSIAIQFQSTLAYFDLTTGLAQNETSGVISATSTDVGNGWYRCSIVFNISASSTCYIYPAENGSVSATSGSIYIQDAQLEIGLAATDYIESGATKGKAGLLENEPRFDYSGGATCPSLLLEPSRTNLVQSEYFGTYTNSNSTIESNATTSPEGLANATSFLEAATTGQHKLVTSLSLDGSSTYTLSIFAKHNGRDLYIDTGNSNEWGGRAWFDLTAGTANAVLGTADIEDFGNGWYRCIVTGASILAGGNQIELLTSDGAINSTTGDITKGVYIYGAQFEVGTYPTSYIPNHSSGSVTRGGEGQTYSGFSSLMGQTEGTLFLDIDGHSPNGTELFSLNRSTTNAIFLDANNDVYRIILYADSVSSTTFTSVANTDRIKIAIAYQSNNFAIYANGLQVATNNTWTWTPNIIIDTLNFSVGGYVNSKNSSKFNQVVLFKERLSNADLETLTT
jgi:hypothetical protein